MTRKLERHGFDVAAFSERVRAELVSRGVGVEHDERNPWALKFAERALQRYSKPVENVFAHPFFAHVAAVHGSLEQPVGDPDCKDCALLWVLWLPYKLEKSLRDKRWLEVAEAYSEGAPSLKRIRDSLEAIPSAADDVALLDVFEERLRLRAALHERAEDPEIKQALRPGRRSNDLLRRIERVLKRAGFRDAETAQLVFGDSLPPNIQSIRDRRRSRSAEASTQLE